MLMNNFIVQDCFKIEFSIHASFQLLILATVITISLLIILVGYTYLVLKFFFIWLHQTLVVACEFLVCSIWNLVP